MRCLHIVQESREAESFKRPALNKNYPPQKKALKNPKQMPTSNCRLFTVLFYLLPICFTCLWLWLFGIDVEPLS